MEDRSAAQFAFVEAGQSLPPLSSLALGTQDYPDRSATLVVELPSLTGGASLSARGPGIQSEQTIAPCGLPPIFITLWRDNRASSRAASISSSRPAAIFSACPQHQPSDRGGIAMYVAVKGGEAAIANAHRLLADRRRGDRDLPAITNDQVVAQLSLAVDRVMAEASLYDPALAALAVRQARGDMIEAIFILRAYRTTLPRFGASRPVETGEMAIERRISATYKDLPGGQLLGPTFDYTHRLLDPSLLEDGDVPEGARRPAGEEPAMRVSDILAGEGLIEGMARPAARTAPATSPARRWNFPWAATPACRRWPAATRAFCSHSPIPPSAATPAPIPLPAKSASAASRWKSTVPSLALPPRSAACG